MAKKKKKSGLGVAVFSLIVLVGAIAVGYYFLDKEYGDKIKENTTTVESTTKSVIDDNSPYVTLENGDYKGMTIYKVYKDVFEGNQKVVYEDKEYTIGEYLNSTNPDINDIGEVKASKYASVDMDNDGVDEVIVKLDKGEDCVYAILHYLDSKVYGYSYVYNRSLLNLKVDGTFNTSSGANSSQVAKMSFETTKIQINELAANNESKYTVNGAEASQEEFDNFIEKQKKKTDVSFIEIN